MIHPVDSVSCASSYVVEPVFFFNLSRVNVFFRVFIECRCDKPRDNQCYAHVVVGRAVRDFLDVKYQRTHAIVKMYDVTSTF